MKNYIKVKLDGEHCYSCIGEILARQNENRATALQISLTEEMLDKWFYIEFLKPDNTKISTPRLEVDIENKQVVYEITNALTDQVGKIVVEIVIRDENNLVWKSYKKNYQIIESTNASEEIKEENPDFITEAQKLLDEIKESGGSGGIAEEKDPTVPQHVKDITEQDIEKWNNKASGDGVNEVYVGEYEPTDESVEIWIDPTEEADKIPTKTSELENDSGFITEIPEEYAKKTDIPSIDGLATEEYVNNAIQNALEVVENGTY